MGSGVNDRIFSFAEYNGDLIVGGYFDTAGGLSAYNIAVWRDSTWDTLWWGVNNEVAALVEYNDELVMGGSFTALSDGTGAGYFAVWNESGGVVYVPALNGRVYDMCIIDSMLIFAGDFSHAGFIDANNIVAWQGEWQYTALGTGTDGPVYSVAVHDGELYAGGDFMTAGGVVANNIAKWNGSEWVSLSNGVSYDGDSSNAAVYALESYKGRLYAGGSFTETGGTSAQCIASYGAGGWQACGSGTNHMTDPVRALTVFNSQLIAGGYFSSIGGVSDTRCIGAWNGYSWSALGEGLYGDYYPHVWDLYVHNTKLYAGGRFTIAGTDSTANNIALWEFLPD